MTDYSDEPARLKRESLHGEPDGPTVLPDANIFSFNAVGIRTGPVRSESTDLVPASRPTYNVIFGSLVRDDADIAGFVAYGLYKQNKRDWCIAFEQEHRRPPDGSEIKSYILGESTERRLATYRNLAAQIVPAREPDTRNRLPVPIVPQGSESTPLRAVARLDKRLVNRNLAVMQKQPKKPFWMLFAYLLFLIVLVVGIAWVARYGAAFMGLR